MEGRGRLRGSSPVGPRSDETHAAVGCPICLAVVTGILAIRSMPECVTFSRLRAEDSLFCHITVGKGGMGSRLLGVPGRREIRLLLAVPVDGLPGECSDHLFAPDSDGLVIGVVVQAVDAPRLGRLASCSGSSKQPCSMDN